MVTCLTKTNLQKMNGFLLDKSEKLKVKNEK